MENSTETSKKACCFKQWIISSLTAFVFLLAYDWFVHQNLLKEAYQAAHMWHSEEEMKTLFPLCLLPSLLIGMLTATAYGFYRRKLAATCVVPVDGKKPCMLSKSLTFGLWIGLFMAVFHAKGYIFSFGWVPANIAADWVVADIVQGVLLGAVLKLTYCGKKDVTPV